jgi:hypothetical protein
MTLQKENPDRFAEIRAGGVMCFKTDTEYVGWKTLSWVW